MINYAAATTATAVALTLARRISLVRCSGVRKFLGFGAAGSSSSKMFRTIASASAPSPALAPGPAPMKIWSLNSISKVPGCSRMHVKFCSSGTGADVHPEAEADAEPGPGFLPLEFACSSAWTSRLKSPLLKKIELDDLYYEIDKKYASGEGGISPIDVDLYVSKVTDPENLEELEELIYRLRKSPSAADVLECTGHTAARTLMELDQIDTLMRILDDRMNYGVFLDGYMGSLLMDRFLSDGNHAYAAKIASLFMLQEDFSDPICKILALTSCLRYVENPGTRSWEIEDSGAAGGQAGAVAETTSKKQEEADERVRVRVLRNPYFDDHFELTNPQNIVGKTLAYLSMDLNSGEDELQLRKSIELLGYALWDKWAKVDSLLQKIVSEKTPIYAEVLQKVADLLKNRLAAESLPSKPKIKVVPGLEIVPAEVDAAFERLGWNQMTVEPLPRISEYLGKYSDSIVKISENLLPKVENLLKSTIATNQASQIASMNQTYESWNTLRQNELDHQLTRYQERSRLLEIREQKKDLKEREDVIFFFDNEEKWMMELDKPKPRYYNVIDRMKKKKRGLPVRI